MFDPTRAARLLPRFIEPRLNRREVLFSSLFAGGALLIGCSSTPNAPDAAPQAAAAPPAPSPFEAYLAIDASGTITVYSSQFDMGQLVYHGIATLVAEELNVPVTMIDVVGRAGNPKLYGNLMMGGTLQLTGGSTSMPTSYLRYRTAGATARALLVAAAAERWQVAPQTLDVRDGAVVSADGTRKAGFGELIARAAQLPVPTITLKPREQFTQIGVDSTRRRDSQPKSTGAQNFTIDLKLPNMKVASVLHAPRFGGKLKSFDATAAKAVPGVVDVVAISSGIAVVAEHTWAAFKGVEALSAEWDFSAAETRSSAQILDSYVEQSKTAGLKSVARGDAAAGIAGAAKVIEATYRFPYLAHAALEPLNAVAHLDGDTLHLYGGLQMPDVVQGACAAVAGIAPNQVALRVQKTGGGFGRRAVVDSDVFVEATEIAKATGFKYPIKLQWRRETDMSGGRYRPAHVHRVRVGLRADGGIAGWQHHIVGQSILGGTPFEAMMKDGIDSSSTEGVSDTPYQIADFAVDVTHPKSPVTVLWWRSVGHTHTAYVMQTMLDEIAEATGEDPVALRLKLLPKDARERAVLELAAEKAGWSTRPPAALFRGVAVHQSFGSYVATVAEVSKTADGAIKVDRLVIASDCGLVINPDIVRAQLEGGAGFALGAFLNESLTLADGGAIEQNYDRYRPLRIDAMPKIECHLLPSTLDPTGIGECAVPPLGPAVANAIFRATGNRVRDLPYLKA
jgi:isoquinoline 1-oxidoreductase subunit beta